MGNGRKSIHGNEEIEVSLRIEKNGEIKGQSYELAEQNQARPNIASCYRVE